MLTDPRLAVGLISIDLFRTCRFYGFPDCPMTALRQLSNLSIGKALSDEILYQVYICGLGTAKGLSFLTGVNKAILHALTD
jgi:hypothetical protein